MQVLVQMEPSTFCLESTPGEPEKWIIPKLRAEGGGGFSVLRPLAGISQLTCSLSRGRRSHARPHPHPRDKEAEQQRLFARGANRRRFTEMKSKQTGGERNSSGGTHQMATQNPLVCFLVSTGCLFPAPQQNPSPRETQSEQWELPDN